jgi:thioesterase domain-containing protein
MERFRLFIAALGAVVVATLAIGQPVPSAAAANSADSGKGIVYLFRGGFNVFSTGMDDLATALRAEGVNAHSVGFTSWQDLADKIAAEYKDKPRPVVLGGHSFGANAALLAAERLGRSNVPVTLVVLFDPTDPMQASANIRRVINFVSADSQGYNVDVKPSAGHEGTVENILHAEVSHITIDNDMKIQAQAIDAINKVVGSRVRAAAN